MIRTQVIMENEWLITKTDGVYAVTLSDGNIKLLTHEEAIIERDKLEQKFPGRRFRIMNVADTLLKLLKHHEENLRLAKLELERVRKLVEDSGLK